MERVADLLSEHVTLRLPSVDRIGVHGYIQRLAYEGGLVRFLLNRGYRLPTPRGLAQNHERLVSELDRFVADNGLEMKLIDYVPCYRTEAGTGCAMGFATWQ